MNGASAGYIYIYIYIKITANGVKLSLDRKTQRNSDRTHNKKGKGSQRLKESFECLLTKPGENKSWPTSPPSGPRRHYHLCRYYVSDVSEGVRASLDCRHRRCAQDAHQHDKKPSLFS